MNNPATIANEAELDELLSRPTPGVMETLGRQAGDVVVLGVAGKMGITLARMVRRALPERYHVIGVSRFSQPAAREELERQGVETIRSDLLDRAAVTQLPEAPNVIFMAGQKFGTSDGPEVTWAMNTIVPAHAAEKYRASRVVVFSTGCVYPLAPVVGGGSRETDALGPPGDYANSCVGRERIFTHFAKQHGTPCAMYRLSYAIDLRYGVLLDLASKVWQGEVVDVAMGHANIIWQRDANAWAIQCLDHAAKPPFLLNATGREIQSIRDLARRLGQALGREPIITGTEASTAWVFNAQKANELFGEPTATVDEMVGWAADWVKRGGATLGKPTHFEVRDGKF